MKITIHKIEKYNDKWKVTFTSERNSVGKTIYTPVFQDETKLYEHLYNYIINNFPVEVVTEPKEIDFEPTQEEPKEITEELSEEEQQRLELEKQLNDLENEKMRLANEIAALLSDWKLDLDLFKFKEKWGFEDSEFDEILQAKLNRKLPKYIELKTQYEQIKQQINELKEQLTSQE